jgi:hypothetical protein
MHGAAVVFALLTVVGSENPFVGTWTINFSKSQLHPSYQIKDSTLSIAVAGADVTLTSDVVLGSGQQQKAAETFHTDGRERSGTHTPGVVLLARWLGSHKLETRAKKDGQEIAVGTYEVSPDGKTLTARMSGTAALEMVVVFERK